MLSTLLVEIDGLDSFSSASKLVSAVFVFHLGFFLVVCCGVCGCVAFLGSRLEDLASYCVLFVLVAQGLHHQPSVIVVATTSRMDCLDR